MSNVTEELCCFFLPAQSIPGPNTVEEMKFCDKSQPPSQLRGGGAGKCHQVTLSGGQGGFSKQEKLKCPPDCLSMVSAFLSFANAQKSISLDFSDLEGSSVHGGVTGGVCGVRLLAAPKPSWWKGKFISDSSHWGRGWWVDIGPEVDSPHWQPVGKSFYRQKEGAACRKSRVSSHSHLQIGHQWSDQHHLGCFRYSSRSCLFPFLWGQFWNCGSLCHGHHIVKFFTLVF